MNTMFVKIRPVIYKSDDEEDLVIASPSKSFPNENSGENGVLRNILNEGHSQCLPVSENNKLGDMLRIPCKNIILNRLRDLNRSKV